MKQKVLPLFAFFFIFIGTAYANAPKLIAPEQNFEFTGVIEGEKVIHSFSIQNIGQEILKINRVKASG